MSYSTSQNVGSYRDESMHYLWPEHNLKHQPAGDYIECRKPPFLTVQNIMKYLLYSLAARNFVDKQLCHHGCYTSDP
jgi:hypothetical protein